MFKFIQRLFTSMDSEDSATYDMLDVLAFNCNQLSADLFDSALSSEDQNRILFEYLTKADATHKSINNFKDDLDWFNVTEPLSTKDSLLGKIVILDFFTYCCINCMHILPDLKKLEQLYTVEDGVVVVGVHSAKFDNEKDSANILSAVQRYDITHPVVNDGNSSMWMDLKIKCWPTLLILGPRANPLFVLMGEGNYEALEKYIGATVKYYKSNGSLRSHALPLNPATELIVSSNLKFPGKIVCSKASDDPANSSNTPELYAISDSGNHRVVIIDAAGKVIHKIGGKGYGFVDGDFKTARFNSPQGLTFLNSTAEVLFVADTENHAIRKIDLVCKTVETIAGTGLQGEDRVGGKIGRDQELSSPWDVAVYRTRDMDMSFHMDEEQIPEKDILLVAIAGLHQIWAIFLEDVIWWKFRKYLAGTVVAIAGNGKEENRNNSYPANAAFAQPSGLAINRSLKELYIADSESSCVRKLSLTDGKVLAVAGADRNPLNLFAYGDLDGKQMVAKMQHPLGVAFNSHDQSIYVADTYNHKVKRIDIATNTCTTCNIAYDATAGIQLAEPGGLCLSPSGDTLYVADTNNHRIEVIDLHSLAIRTLQLSFNVSTDNGNGLTDLGLIIQSRKIRIRPRGGALKINVQVSFSDGGMKLTESAPQKWNVFMPNEKWQIIRQNGTVTAGQPVQLDISVPSNESNQDEEESIAMAFKLNLCAGDICFPKLFSLTFPIVYDAVARDDDSIIETLTAIVGDDTITLA